MAEKALIQTDYSPSPVSSNHATSSIKHRTACYGVFCKIGSGSQTMTYVLLKMTGKNPTLGAAGIGWEVRCNEMEVLQYTYFQQLGSEL